MVGDRQNGGPAQDGLCSLPSTETLWQRAPFLPCMGTSTATSLRAARSTEGGSGRP